MGHKQMGELRIGVQGQGNGSAPKSLISLAMSPVFYRNPHLQPDEMGDKSEGVRKQRSQP